MLKRSSILLRIAYGAAVFCTIFLLAKYAPTPVLHAIYPQAVAILPYTTIVFTVIPVMLLGITALLLFSIYTRTTSSLPREKNEHMKYIRNTRVACSVSCALVLIFLCVAAYNATVVTTQGITITQTFGSRYNLPWSNVASLSLTSKTEVSNFQKVGNQITKPSMILTDNTGNTIELWPETLTDIALELAALCTEAKNHDLVIRIAPGTQSSFTHYNTEFQENIATVLAACTTSS